MLKQATGKKKKHESEFPGFLYFLTTNLEQNSKLKKKKSPLFACKLQQFARIMQSICPAV